MDLRAFSSHYSTRPNSFEHTHETQRIRLDTHNIVPLIRLLEDLLPRLDRPFLRIEQRHHPQIRRGTKALNTPRQLLLTRLLLAHVINKHDPRTLLERGSQRLQNLDAFDIGPVVQDPLQYVHVGFDGLRVEQVVGEERDAVFELREKFLLEHGCDIGEILDADFQVGEFAGEDRVVVAGGSAELKGGNVSGGVLVLKGIMGGFLRRRLWRCLRPSSLWRQVRFPRCATSL